MLFASVNQFVPKMNWDRACRVATLIGAFLVSSGIVEAHEVTQERKINRLGVRVSNTQQSIDQLWWVLAFIYLAVSIIGGGVCGFWAASAGRNVGKWFAFGFLLHIVAIPTAIRLHVADINSGGDHDSQL